MIYYMFIGLFYTWLRVEYFKQPHPFVVDDVCLLWTAAFLEVLGSLLIYPYLIYVDISDYILDRKSYD